MPCGQERHRYQAGYSLIYTTDLSGNLIASVDSAGSGNGQFNDISAIAVDNGGNVYVADMWTPRIQKLDGNLHFLAAWGSAGTGNGQFHWPGPTDIAIDSSGNVYALDSYAKNVQVFDFSGNFLAKCDQHHFSAGHSY